MDRIQSVEINAQSAAIIEAVKAHNFVVGDDHMSGKDQKISGIAIFSRDDKQHVVALFNSAFSPYYSINRMRLDDEGKPFITRDSRSTMFHATMDLAADIDGWYAGFDWDRIAKHPVLHPGQLTNLVVAN